MLPFAVLVATLTQKPIDRIHMNNTTDRVASK